MELGDNVSVSLISKPNNSEYINTITVDGAAVTEEWAGATVPSAASGAASTWTNTTINLIRVDTTGTANTDLLVLCTVTNFGN